MNSSLPAKIESLLFYTQEPTDVEYIAEVCNVKKSQVEKSLKILKEKLSDRGISLIIHNESAQLVTADEFSDFISKVREEEVNTDLTSAQSEALAIIAYLAPVQKVKIDFVRGVNSRAVLRNLLARGLITKDQKDGKTLYNITSETLAHLGITDSQELPEYEDTRQQLYEFTENDEDSFRPESTES